MTPLRRLALAILKPLFILAALPVYLAMRILEPWRRIKVGLLIYDRIGHLVYNTEGFLRTQAVRANGSVTFLVSGPPANQQLLKMISRRTPVFGSRLALHLYYQGLRPYIQGTRFHEPLYYESYEYELFAKAGPQLSFTPEEEARGRERLKAMGIPEGRPFVCFHARDKAYLDRVQTHRSRAEWSYHDFRDCRIENYLPAARSLVQRGGHALRMGSVVERPIPEGNARLIDYATRFRDDFLDIYLLAHCKYFLCNTAGMIWVSSCFGVPVAAANYCPLGYAPWRAGDLFTPKTYRDTEGRDIPFRRIVALGADQWMSTQEFAKAGIEVVENSAEDVAALSEEMDARLDGRWEPQSDDEELQGRYRALFPKRHPVNGFPSRVGAAFLRRHRSLLD